MARYYVHKWPGSLSAPDVPIGPFMGGKFSDSTRMKALMAGQDHIPTLGRRILLRKGLEGETSWLTPDSDPDSGTNTHPLTGVVRTVARGRYDLTPGHYLRMACMYVPSGETQELVGAGDYDAAGAGGILQLDVTWTDRDGTSVSTTHQINLEGSAKLHGAAPEKPWEGLRVAGTQILLPESLDGIADLNQWSRHSHVQLRLSHVGGCRVIDAVVYEYPYGICLEADDASDLWVSHLWGGGFPTGPGPNLPYPFQRMSEDASDGDPRGIWHLSDVSSAQQLRLGPALIQISPYNESVDPGDTESWWTLNATSSTDWIRFPDEYDTGSTANPYDATEPGYSIASAAYARPLAENSGTGMENNGSVPVRVWVYAQGAGASSACTVRVVATDYSWVDVPIESFGAGVAGWTTAYGHLRCGRGPGDPSIVQVYGLAGTDRVDVGQIVVHKADQYAYAS